MDVEGSGGEAGRGRLRERRRRVVPPGTVNDRSVRGRGRPFRSGPGRATRGGSPQGTVWGGGGDRVP